MTGESEAASFLAAVAADGTPDFGALFDLLPSPYMIVDRDMRYVAANAAYCAVLDRPREALIGRNIFEAFPEPGESGQRLLGSFRRVLDTGETDTIALIPYPIERPAHRGGGFEMRYWSAVHIPLKDADGATRYLLQNTVEVTELQRLKTMAFGPVGESASGPAPGEPDLFQRVREVEAAHANLLRETRDLRDLFMQAPGFMAVLEGSDLTFVLVNNAYQQLIGGRQIVGRPLAEALPEVMNQGFGDLLRDVMARRAPYIGRAVSVQLQRSADAPLEERFVDFIYQPIHTPTGEISGVFVEGSDVTDRVLAERQQKLLVDELNHRVKNTLATVQAIARQTARATPDPMAFREAFEARLLALSSTHNLLTAAGWVSAGLADVLRSELSPYGEGRFQLSGEAVALSPGEAVALGLVFHELATNAAKYGALSAPDGRIEVAWAVEGAQLLLSWREFGGPPVTAPSRRGFGSRLIERSLDGQMGGRAALEFAETGLICRIRLPLVAN
ncbi:MAG: PAS domain-containing protein [Phenylobacterium sp.]|nr:PAS domain-containing protein [Phenylobacterium sp.]